MTKLYPEKIAATIERLDYRPSAAAIRMLMEPGQLQTRQLLIAPRLILPEPDSHRIEP